MRNRIAVMVGLVATVVGIGVLAPTGASADTGVMVLAGQGTVSPGITISPNNETFTFAGTGVIVTTTTNTTTHGIETCTWTGGSSETFATGIGDFTGNCVGALTSAISGSFIRSNVAEYTFTGSAPGFTNGTISGVCTFVPTNLDTSTRITAYSLECVISIP